MSVCLSMREKFGPSELIGNRYFWRLFSLKMNSVLIANTDCLKLAENVPNLEYLPKA